MTLLARKLAGRSLELELLITAALLLVAGLAMLVLDARSGVRWMDVTIAGAYAGIFLALSWRWRCAAGARTRCCCRSPRCWRASDW